MTQFVPAFSTKIEQAIELATQWHDLTYRKSRWREVAFDIPPQEELRVPVVAHVTAVAMTVQRAGWSEDAVAAAFLHDALEDINRFGMLMRRERLIELMGETVATLVEQVTEKKFDEDGNHRSWSSRKRDYLDVLRRALPEAVAISVADKLHNLWSINQSMAHHDAGDAASIWSTLNAGPPEQYDFNRAVLTIARTHDDPRFDDMCRMLEAEIERFADLAGISG